jgi:ATP-dependent Clp protease ATP-binding subunit ClpC
MYRESELGFTAKTAKDKKALAEEYEENKSYAMKALKKVMRPELINRLDNILVFHALTKKNVEKIFDNLIDDLKKRLATKGIGLKVDEKAKEYLIQKGYDPKNGARPLRRKIEDEVESLLSEAIISEELKKGDIPTLKLSKGKLKLVKE